MPELQSGIEWLLGNLAFGFVKKDGKIFLVALGQMYGPMRQRPDGSWSTDAKELLKEDKITP
jgi:hypothetical protein